MSFEAKSKKKKIYFIFQNVHYIKEIDLNDCLRTIKKSAPRYANDFKSLIFCITISKAKKRVEKNKKERKKKLRKKFDTS